MENLNQAHPQRWWIAGVILIGTCVGTMGNSLIPIALPSMLSDFGIPMNIGIWVISIYALLMAVFMPIFGWAGDRYGYRRTYIGGMAGFALFSFAAALAPGFGWLIVFRVAQGICNATTLPSVMGILSQVFPGRQRGKAMGVWGVVNGAAHGMGPVISGFLVHSFDWRAIFLFNGALTMVGLLLMFRFVPVDHKHNRRPFDWLGAGAFSLAVLCLMLNLSQSGKTGWHPGAGYLLWALFVALAVGFTVTEKRIAQPFVDLKLFANRSYSALVAIASSQFFCLMGYHVLVPFYLIRLRGLAEVATGPIVALLPASLALFSPIAGQMVDRKGYPRTIRTGMITISAAAISCLFWIETTPLWLVGTTLALMGLGMSLVQSPAPAGVTLVTPNDQMGVALGIFNMLRFVSVTLSATLCGLILAPVRTGDAIALPAFRWGFILMAGVALAGTVLAITIAIPKRYPR